MTVDFKILLLVHFCHDMLDSLSQINVIDSVNRANASTLMVLK